MSSQQKKVSGLQKKIIDLKNELASLEKLEQPLPEFINTTNILRSNEYLKKVNEKKSQLLDSYKKYVVELEKLILAMSKIQRNLLDLKTRVKSRKTSKKKIRKKAKSSRSKKRKTKSRRKSRKKYRR